MKEKVGEVFSMVRDNQPIPGCTLSKEVHSGDNQISYFSLSKGTGISPEIFPYFKLILLADGTLDLYEKEGRKQELKSGQGILTRPGRALGLKTLDGAIYTEVLVKKEDMMKEIIQPGQVFTLTDLVTYQEGKIVNMDLGHKDAMKIALMAFDKGTGLSEHAAPGEALVFALDGQATIGYEGQEHRIKAGENFHFAKGGLHSVKATEKFKMLLILALD